MKYYSTNNKELKVTFREAVLNGLAPDGGLYLPQCIPKINLELFEKADLTIQEIAQEVLSDYINEEISSSELSVIINQSLNFEIPLKAVNDNTYVLELFHGPTLSFKDVGARFMARVLSLLTRNDNNETLVLTATSGDTGSAVANGYYDVKGIKVIILYPENGVSEIQEAQMTTMGKNIFPIKIQGTFDDCQLLIKKLLNDKELKNKKQITSANSINIARLLPQIIYYFYAYSKLKSKKKIAFSVPSGNFGNITAGLLAKKMGLPISFIAATNKNDVFVKYLFSGVFTPQPSLPTISNAMDVGNPSNFYRILELYGHDYEKLKSNIISYSITDEETKSTILKVWNENNYLLDPHGAVAFAAFEKFKTNNQGATGIVLGTAHPAKFQQTVEKIIGTKIEIPETLSECLKKEKSAETLPADFNKVKDYLLEKN